MQRIATYGFFVFEGCNGSGKTTVMNAVAERLRKQCGEDKIVTITNPTKGPVGVEARRFISEAKSRGEVPRFFSSNHETMGFATRLALLFMADRIAAQYAISEAAAQDKIVLCDRYGLSTLIYQCAMVGDVSLSGDLASVVKTVHDTAGFHIPEITFVLDAPVSVLRARLRARGETMDDLMMTDVEPAVRSMYLDFAKRNRDGDGGYASAIASQVDVVNVDERVEVVAGDIARRIRSTEIAF